MLWSFMSKSKTKRLSIEEAAAVLNAHARIGLRPRDFPYFEEVIPKLNVLMHLTKAAIIINWLMNQPQPQEQLEPTTLSQIFSEDHSKATFVLHLFEDLTFVDPERDAMTIDIIRDLMRETIRLAKLMGQPAATDVDRERLLRPWWEAWLGPLSYDTENGKQFVRYFGLQLALGVYLNAQDLGKTVTQVLADVG